MTIGASPDILRKDTLQYLTSKRIAGILNGFSTFWISYNSELKVEVFFWKTSQEISANSSFALLRISRALAKDTEWSIKLTPRINGYVAAPARKNVST
jgi:hypothetical protein